LLQPRTASVRRQILLQRSRSDCSRMHRGANDPPFGRLEKRRGHLSVGGLARAITSDRDI